MSEAVDCYIWRWSTSYIQLLLDRLLLDRLHVTFTVLSCSVTISLVPVVHVSVPVVVVDVALVSTVDSVPV